MEQASSSTVGGVPHHEKILRVYNIQRENNELPYSDEIWIDKNNEKSRAAEKKGRKEFDAKRYTSAMEQYNKALCFATSGSVEMGYAYASRAAIYLDMGFLAFCMENINLARGNGYPLDKRENLKTLEAEYDERMSDDVKDAAKIYEMPAEPPLSHPAMPKNPNAIEGLEFVEDHPIYGRCLRSKVKLEAGDVFLREKPFVQVLFKDDVYKYCFHCGAHNFFNLMPSKLSTKAMFCSEACSVEAFRRYFNIECKMLDGLFKYLDLDDTLVAIRIILKALSMVDYNIAELKKIVESSTKRDDNPLKINWMADNNEKDKFRALYRLETHNQHIKQDSDAEMEHLRNCSVAWHILVEYSGMKESLEKHRTFFLGLIFHFSRIAYVNCLEMCNNCLLGAGDKSKESVQEAVNYGLAISLIFSYFSHSCLANTWSTTSGVHFASMPIEPNTPLAISYLTGDILKYPAPIRKKHLNRIYYFECQCPICAIDFRYKAEKSAAEASGDPDLVPSAEIESEMAQLKNRLIIDKRQKAMQLVLKIYDELKKIDCNTPRYKLMRLQEYHKHCVDLLHCTPTLGIIFVAKRDNVQVLKKVMRD